MPFLFYKLMHLVGIFMVVVPLGGLMFHRINGGDRKSNWRFTAAITHGVGMVLALVGGFGMLARLGIVAEWPLWVTLKFIIWIALGAVMSPILRRPIEGFLGVKQLWWLTLLLASLAAYFALYKPS